jgi:diguanylate cyclase (GGDEF)-like protein
MQLNTNEHIEPIKILLVDDDVDNLNLFQEFQWPNNYQIIATQSGKDALVKAKEWKPDLILLDIVMPEMSGFDVCRQLKMDSHLKNTTIIFVTACNDIKDVTEGFRLGGVDYITKPFRKEEVIARVNTHLQLKLLLEEKTNLIGKLDQTSRTDSLTGLSNRRDLLEKLTYEAKRFERSKNPFSIILADIDDFKAINDNYGHCGGDYVLVEIGNLLVSSSRDQDIVSRWGGEEILILLPETDAAGAKYLAEKYRQIIESHNFHFDDKPISVTMSFGVNMVFNKDDPNGFIEAVLKRADNCLYKAKRNGKNQVVCLNEV